MASRASQEAQEAPTWANLAPTWPQLGLSWPHLGPTRPKLGPTWPQNDAQKLDFWRSCRFLGPRWPPKPIQEGLGGKFNTKLFAYVQLIFDVVGFLLLIHNPRHGGGVARRAVGY
eukprot:884856-Karenia_brevis.AAC.1